MEKTKKQPKTVTKTVSVLARCVAMINKANKVVLFSTIGFFVIMSAFVVSGVGNAIFAAVGVSHAVIFTPGSMGQEFRNKIAAQVYSKNHYGQFIRQLVKPHDKKTVKQMLQRANMTLVSQLWRTIGYDNIQAWNSKAAQIPFHNSLGHLIYLTGEALFNKYNLNLITISESPVETAPIDDTAISANDGFAVVMDSGVSDITVSFDSPIAATEKMVLMASGTVSSGVTYNSKYKQFAVLTNAFLTGSSVKDLYETNIAAMPSDGQVVFFAAKRILISTGKDSGDTTLRVVAGLVP